MTARHHLQSIAYRMPGLRGDAEDPVQEAWLNITGTGVEGVGNLNGFFTKEVARICLDKLRSRKARRAVAFKSQDIELEPS